MSHNSSPSSHSSYDPSTAAGAQAWLDEHFLPGTGDLSLFDVKDTQVYLRWLREDT